MEKRWQELLGLNISHCTFGLGTISKVEGEYIYIDLPERQGKKLLLNLGWNLSRGFFRNCRSIIPCMRKSSPRLQPPKNCYLNR